MSVVTTISSIVPFSRGRGFDAEATQNLGKAYDIACRSLHPKGRPPVFQEILAKKIIEAAQRGERDPDRLAAIALGVLGPFYRDVTFRFGLIPNFFMSAPEGMGFSRYADLQSPQSFSTISGASQWIRTGLKAPATN